MYYNKHTPKCQSGFCVILEKGHIKTLPMSRRWYVRWDKIKKKIYTGTGDGRGFGNDY